MPLPPASTIRAGSMFYHPAMLIAEAIQEGKQAKTAFDFAMQSTMKRARALGKSADRISCY